MGTSNAPGPTGLRVSRNLRKIREDRDYSVRDLADRLTVIGRPLYASAISKIELGQRRVDVDELVALSIALDCTPNRILLAPIDDEELELTDTLRSVPERLRGLAESMPTTTPSCRNAWRWARGGEPLDVGPHVEGLPADEQEELARYEEMFAEQQIRRRRFQQENRPDDVPDFTDFGDLSPERQALLDAVADSATPAVLDAMDAGFSWKTILRRLRIQVDKVLWQRHRDYLENRTPEDVEREREEGRRAAAKILGKDGADRPPGGDTED